MTNKMTKQEKFQHTTIIPDETCHNAGLTLQWSGIGQFGVHAFRHKACNSSDIPSEFAPVSPKLYHIRNNSVLFNPIIRQLVNESSGTFLAVQKLTPSKESRPEALKFSRQYRSIVRECIVNLQDPLNYLDNEQRQHYIAIFYSIELLWHLCEIMCIDIVPNEIVVPYLVHWIRFHFPDLETAAGQILSGPLDSGAEIRHENYWKVVTGLIMQGSIEVARAILRLHTDADSNAFLQAESSLRSLPIYSVAGGLSATEFKNRWITWKTNTKSKITAGVFVPNPQLETVIKIVCGEDDIMEEMRLNCDTWYQMMIAALLYKEPTIKMHDLHSYANNFVSYFTDIENLKLLDKTILSLLECNVPEVLKNLYAMSDSGWCVTHLSNLLYFTGHQHLKPSKGSNSRLDEHLMIEYGSLLMSHKSLWQVGVTYLDHCPTQGRTCIELLLPRIKLGSEARTLKIIQIAADRDMPDIVNGICKVEGMNSLKRKRVGQALCWALRSQDPGFATHIADSLLHYYAQEGYFHSVDLLDNLGSCMLISDRLTFLGKYCEFHQLYRNGALREAATLLTSLFASKLCPKYFWFTLLIDALPLLESQDPPILSSEDTSELLACLEELAIESNDHNKPSKHSTIILEKTKLIRVALSKNLSNSLIYEACHPPISVD